MTATTAINIREALNDERLFGGVLRDKATWAAWRAFLGAFFGLPLSDPEADTFRRCTGRELPTGAFSEGWLVCGRHSGKSFLMGLVAVFLACFRSYLQYLGPGERATIMIVAADRKQARVVMRYIKGLLAIPMLARLVEREAAESIDLAGQVTIEVMTSNFRNVRGYTIAAALLDEVSFWPTEDSATPDVETIASIRPAMATIPNAVLLCASSPYARRGALWEAFRRYYGQDDKAVLVWRAPTRTMNPTLPQRVIDEAMERDPAYAAAEYGAEFRVDVETFIPREVVESATRIGRYELPFASGNPYVAFTDPSGGVSDSMTHCIAHFDRKTERTIIDLAHERKAPFSPDQTVIEFAQTLKSYHVVKVVGDRYAGEWCRERFREAGITYELAEKAKSDLYRDALPRFTTGRVELPDSPRLVNQLCSLERRTARGGRDSIDHPPGGRDDVANAVCGAICLAQVPSFVPIPAAMMRRLSEIQMRGRVL
jgi:hypothetical protein